jgi:hypothetical protein
MVRSGPAETTAGGFTVTVAAVVTLLEQAGGLV